MKYYESTLNDYIERVTAMNAHETHPLLCYLQDTPTIDNMIFYGPSGVGKYSQMLYLLSKKMGKFRSQQKLFIQKDVKEKYTYIMSDIYFEIDMGLLGCNSKTLWHEIYQQILDIVIIKPQKTGIIVCKNFHQIHSELLDIFYSYIQDNYKWKDITIKYILLTEQISFISDNIINNFVVINIGRPSIEMYRKIHRVNVATAPTIDDNGITNALNIKDIYKNSVTGDTTMKMICDNIIEQIENPDKIVITHFRDTLYEILTYGLDVGECLWYILSHFYKKGVYVNMDSIYTFLKQFNNNYRPITHLESIFMLFVLEYRKYNDIEITRGFK